MLESRPWQRVAMFASYACQMKVLGLKPWEVPPAHVNNPKTLRKEEQAGAKLLRRMLRAGVSQYHPDPLVALAARI